MEIKLFRDPMWPVLVILDFFTIDLWHGESTDWQLPDFKLTQIDERTFLRPD